MYKRLQLPLPSGKTPDIYSVEASEEKIPTTSLPTLLETGFQPPTLNPVNVVTELPLYDTQFSGEYAASIFRVHN
jgi:hypothetical protein